MPKLTKRTVESVTPAATDVFVWDSGLRGFGLRVKPSGHRSYVVQYRNSHGRSRRLTIGEHGRLTCDQARREAKLLLADVERGDDPAEARGSARKAPTVAEFVRQYIDRHVVPGMKPQSAREEKRLLAKIVLPALGARKLADLARADVARLHHDLRATPRQANYVVSLLSRLFNKAEEWGATPEGTPNPCRKITKYSEVKRERYLSAEELARLGEALANAERTATELPAAVAAVRLLILTGCRLSEVLTLKWEMVDFAGACLRLPDSKTGAKVVHLNAPALSVLAAVERLEGSPWVITGAKTGAHLVNLQKLWCRIRTRAGLEDVRLHDLRHSFASIAVGLGEGLPMIGKLLGHSQVQTTHRYAHLATDPVKVATERVGATIAGLMRMRMR